VEWFSLLNELGPRVEESLPGPSYWEDLPHRILGLGMVEGDATEAAPAPAPASGGLWRRLWSPSPSWRYVTAGVASLAVIGGAWIATRSQPSPWNPNGNSNQAEVTTSPVDEVPLPAEFATPLENQTPSTYMNRVVDKYAPIPGGQETSLDLLPGQVVSNQGHSRVGTQVTQMGLSEDMRALAEEVVPYGCGVDSLTQVYIAALRAEQAGDFAVAALGYRLLMDRVPPSHLLHQYADYRLTYLIWKRSMEGEMGEQARTMAKLNRSADHAYETWQKTGTDKYCRKAWCMNRVLQQLGPEMTEPAELQMASTRVQVLHNCGQTPK